MAIEPHPPNSFDEFVRRWRPDLLLSARKLVGDADLAEDVVQTVLLKLLIAGNWQTIASPRAYFRSAVNREALRALDLRRRSVPLAEVGYTLRSAAPGPLLRIVILEHGSILRAHLDRLPDRCGSVMTLKLFEGLSHAEIATTMGISRRAVDKQVARAREHLRRWLRVGPEGDIEWRPHFRTGGGEAPRGSIRVKPPDFPSPDRDPEAPC